MQVDCLAGPQKSHVITSPPRAVISNKELISCIKTLEKVTQDRTLASLLIDVYSQFLWWAQRRSAWPSIIISYDFK